MYIKGTEGTLLRSNHEGKKSRDRGEQSRRHFKIANATVYKGCQEIPGASKLLQAFCEGLFQSNTTNESIDKEE